MRASQENRAVRPRGMICTNEKVIDPPDSGNTGSSSDDVRCKPCEGEIQWEEAKKNKGLSHGIKPSQREIDDHERTHLPFRSW